MDKPILIRNSQVATVPPESFTIKLKAIIRDKGVRDPKLKDNVFPNKSLSIHIIDICQWFSFNPLDQVIRVDQQPSLIPYRLRKKSNNIQTPLSKWPRVG